MATDRVSLIHFDKLSMSPAAAQRFQTALDALETLKLQDRYVYLVAPYLGDIADASDREQLKTAEAQCVRVVEELLAAKSITKAKSEELRKVFEEAAERVRAEMPA
ncbi:hypothetical protein V7V80_14815 [Pseudomonas kermanshahensis]|jgi:ERCC4-type nuclease|uniref:Uncharacterized protein n=1 Tax=Pseudomonas kermanshahensis TaxID=2745482 RepID=A0ABU8R7X9_9PSED|nr:MULTISPECIES: hypothetical protein [Pseudomonas]GLO58316.1 hypothetical protein PPUJ20066_43520 [Pseudomonas putida]MBC3486691.1 hypothetical protein [Pseudomonas sp. SWRI50]MBC3497693.1 hypothetical protein [Pseudomonas sp. SWRI67]MBV4526399.1 hypothetical protein [Pseudomonas kermanshahensis]MDE4538330.1 hypothetical protein [Pseudomonas sp. ITEM 17296]